MTLAKLSNTILEIGFNMGHSCLMMLLANPNCKIDCFDICTHRYTEKCFEYIESQFPNRVFLYKGDSKVTVPKYEKIVDMCHIDGSHDMHDADTDFSLCLDKTRSGGIIVFDDTWLQHIAYLWSVYISRQLVRDINILPSIGIQVGHSIGRKL
jgi:predicted O-methyltransferase YrrM